VAIKRGLAAFALLLGAGFACAEGSRNVRPAVAGLPASSGAASADPASAPAPTLDALISQALDSSRELAAVGQQIAAAEARVVTAGALPDPMLSAGLSNVPVGGIELDGDMMSGVEFMLSRSVTAGARRRLRSDIQRAEADSLRQRYQSTRNGIVREVKRAYLDLQYLDEALDIAEQNRQLAADVLAIAESQYATGRAMQQDVFQSQVQLSRMVESLVLLRRQRAAAVTRMNRLLYRRPQQELPKLPPLAAGPAPAEAVAAEALQQRNSVVRESLARLSQAERQLALANEWRRPDYSLGFTYMIRQQVAGDPMTGDDMWGASIGIGLPWLNRAPHEQEVKAAEADRSSIEESLHAQVNDISARLEELRIEIERAEEQLALVETGLLPQAEGALAASRSAYMTGKTDALNVLSNQLSLYNLQMERIQLLEDHEQSLAEFDYMLSGALQPEAMGGAMPAPAMAAGPSAPMGSPSSGGM
jgi:outer membrane protein TolC